MANPDNLPAFEALEEQLFMDGDWDQLVTLYRRRLEAPSLSDPSARVAVLFRLAQVLEERHCEVDEAVEVYTQIARLSPGYRPALRQLRTIYTRREQWELVLQVAELESQTEMPPHEQATFDASLGEIWRRELLDLGEAMKALRRALSVDPDHPDALRSLAMTHESLGEATEAAACWARLDQRLRGAERAPVLVAIGRLATGPLADPARAEACFRDAIEADPHCVEAVDALLIITAAREGNAELGDLYQQRFDLTSGARRRTAIALEAARLQLEQLDDRAAARAWVTRALELSPDDAAAHHAAAELARAEGDDETLASSLERVMTLAGSATPPSVLLEAAELHSAAGREHQAVPLLERALERVPDDTLVLEALSDSLLRVGRHDRHAEVLERRASLAHDDPQTRVEVLRELGRVYSEDLADTEAGMDAYRRALAIDPTAGDVSEQLERGLRKQEDWDGLRALLETRCENGDTEQRCRAFCALAELHHEHHAEPTAAARCFEQALALQPESSRALAGLARLARDSGDEEAIVRTCEREARVTRDVERLAELVDELVERLQDANRDGDALAWLERLTEADPRRRDALERAAALQEKLGRSDRLLATLERLDLLVSGADQVAVRRKQATVHAARGDDEQALACWQAALALDGNDVASLRALETHHADRQDWVSLVEIRRALARNLPDDERAACLDALARLFEDELDDTDGALETMARLAELSDAPGDLHARRAGLMERAGRFAELVGLLAAHRDTLAPDDAARADLDLERACLLMDHLDDFEAGEAACRAVLDHDSRCSEALERLERAVRLSDDPARLTALLSELSELEDDPARAAAMHFEQAELLEDALGRESEAAALYEELCESNDLAASDAQRAGERLEQLLERRGDHAGLARRREARLAATDADGTKLSLHEDLAALYADHLEDPEQAMSHLQSATRLDARRPDLWRRLDALYEASRRPADRMVALEAQLECEPDAETELDLHMACARVCSAMDGRAADAREHYECALELDRSNGEALTFLIAQYESAERHGDIARLLNIQLEALPEGEPADRRLDLRLRIAALRRDELDDIDGAVAILEPGLDESGPIAAVAEPLAALYETGAYDDDLARLCHAAADAADDVDEATRWRERLGAALLSLGRDDEAALAYASVLARRPQDRALRDTLCTIYRDLGDHRRLAEELERARSCDGGDALAIRLELAELLEHRLGRQADALALLTEALDADPDDVDLAARVLALAGSLGDHGALAQGIEARLARRPSAAERSELLARRAALARDVHDRPEEAVVDLRDALSLHPTPALRESLCDLLETLGRHAALLDVLHGQAAVETGDERARCLERGADVALHHVSEDVARVWLERLRDARPDDPQVLSRLADLHARAGRERAQLGCIEDELALHLEHLDTSASRERSLELALERARLLEHALRAPARAARALEDARARAPHDARITAALDRLYLVLERPHDRVALLESRLEVGDEPPAQRSAIHAEVAGLLHRTLARPESAVPHLLHAIALTRDAAPRADLLAPLRDALAESPFVAAWCRATEAWIACPDISARERAPVRLDLAERLGEIGRNEAALGQIEALIGELADVDDAEGTTTRDRAEQLKIALLRRTDRQLELAHCLEARASSLGAAHGEWLELAHLQEERLHRPAAAASSYARVLAEEPDCLDALRGARRCAERLGRFDDFAAALEHEIPRLDDDRARAAAWRALAAVHRERLGDVDGAADALRSALAAAPDDLVALRTLQSLCVADPARHAEAIELFERETELLDEGAPDRRREIWREVAQLASGRADARRAERAWAAADAISALGAEDLRAWALLHRELGSPEQACAVFARYCDADDSSADASDHLALSLSLELDLSDREAALERVERAIELDPERAASWDACARLTDDPLARAEALERSAALHDPTDACDRLVAAAGGVEADHPERATELHRIAIGRDPAAAASHAALARIEDRLGHAPEALQAATDAVRLDADRAGLDLATRLECAHIGGRRAAETGDIDACAHFYARALEIEPTDPEALDGSARALFELGELGGVRERLETRLSDSDATLDARQLAMLGCALEADRALDDALDRFERALETDPAEVLAHAGRCRIHEATGRLDEAVASWESWSEVETEPAARAGHLVRAAEVELGRDALEDASAWLELALEADPTCTPAAVALAETAWQLDHADEALAAAVSGLSIPTGSDEERARLELIRARALSRTGDHDEAAQAFATVLEAMPSCSEAAEARAALLRRAGDWSGAAETLGSFIETRRHDADASELCRLLCERGRLLAGPLERVEDAIHCFERALDLDPALDAAREQLANLQSHLPEHFARAITHHEALLQRDPERAGSLRALLRIARDAPRARDAVPTGLAILNALGLTTADERAEAPARLPLRLEPGQWSEPLFERLASAAGHAADGLEPLADDGATLRPDTPFLRALADREAELAADAIRHLDPDQTREWFEALFDLSRDDAERGPLARSIESGLSRRVRRRLRRAFEETRRDDLAAADFAGWRAELRERAAASALLRSDVDLRSALLDLCRLDEPDDDKTTPPEGADLRACVAGSASARRLLARAVRAWCGQLENAV